MSEPITVVVVDDHPMVRQGIAGFLAAQPDIEVVAEATSASEALAPVAEHVPDVILADLVMPGTDGVTHIRDLVSVSPRSAVVVLTSYGDDDHLVPALAAGARSYLLKDVGPEDLAAAIRRAASGEANLSPAVAARVIAELHGSRAGKPDPRASLSAREVEVLRLVADGHPNAEISRRLFISEKTVKSHVSNVLAKLHLADRTQAAAYAWRTGIVER
jgi:NarL family two-component system response regulator LiaR